MRKHLHSILAVAALMLLWGGGKAMAESVLDTSTKKVTAIGEAATTISTDTWYLLKQTRGGTSPAYDAGDGEGIMRASSDDAVTAWGDGVIGSYGADIAKYLLRFVPTETTSTALPTSTVYNLQWATGNYWADAADLSIWGGALSSSSTSAGLWNVYNVEDAWFGIDYYDMAGLVDNNGSGAALVLWGDGAVTSTGGNNVWEMFPVTLEEMTDDDYEAIAQVERNATMLSLIREADAAYEANNTWTYTAGNGLITDASQLSSPYSQNDLGSTDGGDIGVLIDGDGSTYWHSYWGGGGVADDYHYFQVELPEDFEGGDLVAYMQRRNSGSDHITKMGVKDEDDNVIAILDYPFTAQGEELTDHFYCPAGISTLRFYEEEKYNSSTAGVFHLAEFQLYPGEVDATSLNALNAEAAAAFAEAIKTASETYAAAMAEGTATITDSDIEALQAAIDAYKAAIVNIHQCEADAGEYVSDYDRYLPAHWTINNGTTAANFHINTWSVEADASGMVTPFVEYWVYGTTLDEATISHTQLTGLAAGNYYVSIDARIFAETAVDAINEGTTFNANEQSLDLAAAGTADTYGTETEVYGTYRLVSEVGEEGTLDINFHINNANYNWIAWKNLRVEYIGEDMPEIEGVSGKMNVEVEAAQTAAVNAYNADKTADNYIAAAVAMEAAQASVEYYASITAMVEALDEYGAAVWAETEGAAAYEACTLANGDDISASLAPAQIAQITAGSDLSCALLNLGYWTGNTGTYQTGVEHYGNALTAESGKVLYYTLAGLQPGTYTVSFYAVANMAWVGAATGADIAQIFANDATEATTVYDQTACTLSDYEHTLTATVGEDGVLQFGIENIGDGGNWYVAQALTLTLVALDTAPFISAYEEALAAANAEAEDTQLTTEALETLNGVITANTLDTDTATAEELVASTAALNEAVEAAEEAIAALKAEYTAALEAAQAEADEDIKLTTENTTNTLGTLQNVITYFTLDLEGTEGTKATATEIQTAIFALNTAVTAAQATGPALIEAYNTALAAVQDKIAEFEALNYPVPAELTEAIENCTIEDTDAATGDEIQTAIDGLNTGLATAINGVEAGEDSEAIYTLQGVRVSKTTKGIYIKGGKKVIVK